MPVNDFLDLMPHTIFHASLSGRDDYNSPVYGSEASYRARVIYKPTLVKARDGSEVLAKGVIWLATNDVIQPEDQITLPDSTTPPVIAVDLVSDEAEFHHTKIYFG